MIKTLDWDKGDEQLNFIKGNDGDIYVQIWYTDYDYKLKRNIVKYKSVRIGTGNSGGQYIDPIIKQPLIETANRYISYYKNKEFESKK